jgi:hypothetical protein
MTKQKKRIKTLFIAFVAVALTLLSAGAVSAVEVPTGTVQVSIPVTISTSAPIAGGEIEFSASAGLKYIKFVPAAGIQNSIDTKQAGKYYVGFFSSENKYVPKDGRIALGNILFTYEGSASESVAFSEIRLHTKNASAATEAESVDSRVIKPNTIVNVTRATASGNTSSTGNGSSSGSTNSSSTSNTAGVSNSASGGVTVTLPESDSADTNVIDLDAEDIVADEDELASAGADVSNIEDSETPLSQAKSSEEKGSDTPAWLLPAIIGTVALLSILIFFLHRRRRTEEEQEAA